MALDSFFPRLYMRTTKSIPRLKCVTATNQIFEYTIMCLTLLIDETPVWIDVDRKSPAICWLQFGCGSAVVSDH